MELRFHLSGTVLFSTAAVFVPQIGSVVRIRTKGHSPGLHAGSVIEVLIANDDAPKFDYTEGLEVVIHINLEGYTLIKAGPVPD